MKSSLATRKFDRLFHIQTHDSTQSQFTTNTNEHNRQQQTIQNQKSSGDQAKVTKEVRWKMDDLDISSESVTSRHRLLEDACHRLNETLQGLQKFALTEYKLNLGKEMLLKLQEHFLDLVQQQSGDSAKWRIQGKNYKFADHFEEQLISVLASLDRLRQQQSLSTVFSSTIGGGGDEDEVKVIDGSSNSTRRKRGTSQIHKNSWQFWFWRSDQRFLKWDNGLQKLGMPFQTATKLHSILDQLIELHKVAIPSDYSVFREGIKPKWEDVANKEGGAWTIEFARDSADVVLIGVIWRRLLEFLFKDDAETSTARGHICGLKISMRFKAYQLSVWTDRFVDLEKTLLVGIAVQRTIGSLVAQMIPANSFDLSPSAQMHYRAHKMVAQSALTKDQRQHSKGSSSSFGGHHLSDQVSIF